MVRLNTSSNCLIGCVCGYCLQFFLRRSKIDVFFRFFSPLKYEQKSLTFEFCLKVSTSEIHWRSSRTWSWYEIVVRDKKIRHWVEHWFPINFNIRGAYDTFPDFFREAFKIVEDSWKFSTLMLYISWDEWPTFDFRFKWTATAAIGIHPTKPDYLSWWISKMQSDTLEERYVIKFCFKLGKNATETYGILQTAFQPSCTNRASVFEWHKRFKEGRESVRDYEKCGRSKEVNTPGLNSQRVRVRITTLRF